MKTGGGRSPRSAEACPAYCSVSSRLAISTVSARIAAQRAGSSTKARCSRTDGLDRAFQPAPRPTWIAKAGNSTRSSCENLRQARSDRTAGTGERHPTMDEAGSQCRNLSHHVSTFSSDQMRRRRFCRPSRCSLTSACTVSRSRSRPDSCTGVIELAPHEIDALALEPACIRRGEALLLPLRDRLRDVSLHHLAQHELAVSRPLRSSARVLPPGSFSLSRTTSVRLPSLSRAGIFIAKSTRSLSRNGTRVSSECAIDSLSSTTSKPCRKVFASK